MSNLLLTYQRISRLLVRKLTGIGLVRSHRLSQAVACRRPSLDGLISLKEPHLRGASSYMVPSPHKAFFGEPETIPSGSVKSSFWHP
jgi:hypothetical protein